MKPETQRRLLALNKEFYSTVAEPFDETRRNEPPGKVRLVSLLCASPATSAQKVADVGCGNGRLAWMLDTCKRPWCYTGIDAGAELLAHAHANTAGLRYIQTRFVAADIAQSGWSAQLGVTLPHYDAVCCLATLQHIPDRSRRAQVMTELANLAIPQGLVAVSAWQFLTSPRFIERQLPWKRVGLSAQDVEAGDALLPWKQGTYAIRYVHQIDEDEMRSLAATAGLAIEQIYFADGKEGNLNLYAIMRRNQRI